MRNNGFAGFVVAAALLVPAAAVSGQDVPELVARYGDIDAPALVGVVDVEERRAAAAVLTRPGPAVHVFDGGAVVGFGRSGGGPFELQTPSDLAWEDSTLVVLDTNQKKLVAFLRDGSGVGSRSLGDDWARRLYIVGSDTVLGTFLPMSGGRAIVRIRGAARDTLHRYAVRGRQIRLQAAGAPSLTVTEPFAAQVEWTVLSDGLLAVWDPARGRLRLLGMDAVEVASFEPPAAGWRVEAADRAHWLAEAIPSEFMGRRGIFEPLRETAAREVEFPARFAPVLQLLPDPTGAVWIRKTTSGSGEVWVLVGRGGEELGALRLPVGRTVLHVGRRGIYAARTDDLGVEYVEQYRRPAWAGS